MHLDFLRLNQYFIVYISSWEKIGYEDFGTAYQQFFSYWNSVIFWFISVGLAIPFSELFGITKLRYKIIASIIILIIGILTVWSINYLEVVRPQQQELKQQTDKAVFLSNSALKTFGSYYAPDYFPKWMSRSISRAAYLEKDKVLYIEYSCPNDLQSHVGILESKLGAYFKQTTPTDHFEKVPSDPPGARSYDLYQYSYPNINSKYSLTVKIYAEFGCAELSNLEQDLNKTANSLKLVNPN